MRRAVAVIGFCLAALAALLAPAGVQADSFRCGSKLVSTGMKKADVWFRCGEPVWRDKFTDEWYDTRDDFFLPHMAEQEVWVYNFGPTQLLRYLRFENGTLQSIETGDRGFTEGAIGNRGCQVDELKDGMYQFDVIRRCGEPDFTDERQEKRALSKDGLTRSYAINVEEWTYDFGPNRFTVTIMFENGRVTDVSRGERGQ